jgi:predicted glycosyltransferase
MRACSVAHGLSARFRVIFLALGAPTEHLHVPKGVEMIVLPTARDLLTRSLFDALERFQPAAVLLEYYPFGRQISSLHLVPFLKAARAMHRPPLLLTSLRDIQDHNGADQKRYDRRVAHTANTFMDGILVHSDPHFIVLEDTFALVHELTIPVHYTGYAVPPAPMPEPPEREDVILVSMGGGRGCAGLLEAIMEAHRTTSLSRDYRMRVVAGTLLEEQGWLALTEVARKAPNLELLRWVPDLRLEMQRCRVSVSQCGYNTSLDILRTRTPALIVPSVVFGENEQSYRAVKLAERGVWRVLPKDRTTPAILEEEIRKTIAAEPASLTVDCAGAEKSAAILEEMLAGRRVASPA